MKKKSVPLAIVGMGCIFPKAENLTEFWSNIRNGVDAIIEIPETHWKPEDYFDKDPKAPDMTYAKRGGFLPAIDFNPMEFAIAPNAMEGIDTSQLLGLVVAKKALEDAGCGLGKKFNRDKTSVILGITGTQELVVSLGARLGHPIWRRALREAGVDDAVAEAVVKNISESYVGWQESSFPGLLGNVVPGRIANYMDFGGTNCAIDTACASSLSAMHLASLELASGKSDLALSGGVDTFNHIFMYLCFSKTPALSPTGDARPFDHKTDGTILGEGIGMLVLKRLEDAEKDGDKIYAVLRSVGTGSDGKGTAVFAPRAEGQVRAMLDAYRLADIDPRTVELLEAHGTGTKVGDSIELASGTKVYQSASRDNMWCALGSIKSQIGHAKAAAGSAGLIKAAMALYHKVLPPTIKVEKPFEEIAAGKTPFYVNTEKRPWMPCDDHPRRAGVSSFGFGGSNFHCVLEEYKPEKSSIDWDGNVQIIAFSAENIEQLKDKLNFFPAAMPWKEFCLKAEESRASFDPEHAFRLLLVIEKDRSDLAKIISSAKSMLDKNAGKKSWNTPDGVYFGSGPVPGKLGILFPGQGSQYLGMLGDLACQFPQMFSALSEANQSFDAHKASAIKKRLTDYIYPVPVFSAEDKAQNEKALHDTRVAQTALGAVSLGALKVLQCFGIHPDILAGHSFGELTALCAAGRISSEELHSLAALRGKLMAEKKGDLGGMLAVQAELATIEETVRKNNLNLILANRNAPKQGVLSGATEEIAKAAEVFNELGIRNVKLSASAAFHSSLVSKAQVPFAAALEKVKFSKSSLPVFSNTTGEEYPETAQKARDLLAGQLAQPVLFVDEIENMYKAGVRTFLEVGPKTTFTNLAKDILGAAGDHECIALDVSRGRRNGIFDLARTLANLAASGQSVKLSLWDPMPESQKAEMKKPKPKITIPLCGANYVKPKPKKETEPIRSKTQASSKDLLEALRVTQQNMQALQNMQEQTARLHQQFLENQEAALKSFQALAQQQQGFASSPETPIKLPEIKFEMPKPQPIAAPSPAPVSEVKKAPAGDAERTSKILLELVSEKTGYPTEMLELDMNLDADLGIDSIKRVEILSALKEKVPAAGAIKAEHMGTLKTLRNIVDFISNSSQQGAAGPVKIVGKAAASVAAAGARAAGAAADGLEKVSKTLLELVSEKTGYPTEMLELDMNLDADLGIDSIKRVEILSALKEKVPAAGSIKAEHMGTLKTLRNIVDFIINAGQQSVAGPIEAVSKAVSGVAVAGAAAAEAAAEIPKAVTGAAVEVLGAAAGVIQSVFPKEKEEPAPTSKVSDLQRMILSLQKAPAAEKRDRITIPAGSEIWITDDESDLAANIQKHLSSLNYDSKIVSLENLPSLEAPSNLGGLLLLAPADNADDAFLKNSFKLLRLAAPGLRAAGKQGGAVFATVSRLGGTFGLKGLNKKAEALSGGLAGLSKTAQHEWPEVSCKALDIGSVDDAAAQIADELFIKGPVEVGISKEGRSTIELSSSQLGSGESNYPLKKGEVVVVTGGARGVTAECAIKFAEKKPTLVLLGRSKEPSPEPEWLANLSGEAETKKQIMQRAGKKVSPKEVGEEYRRLMANREMLKTISRIKSLGAKVVYKSVDVRDEDALNKVLDEVRSSLGPIKGLIHGAGVISDKLIEEKTDEEFDRVYNTKVIGLRNLLKVLKDDDLKILALFSSSTGRYGRTGQVDYAVANEVLNKLAQQQAKIRPSCRVVSVNWGPWDGGMVTPSLKQLFEKEGVGVIPLGAGADYLVQEVSSDGPVEVVVQGKLPTEKEAERDAGFSVSFEREINLDNFPVLKSHVIDGRAVLPMALIIELLALGAMHGNPGLAFQGFNDLRILKGMKLNGNDSSTLRVLAGEAIKRENLFIVPVELRSSLNGKEFRNARAEMVLSTKPPKGESALSKISLRPCQHLNGNIYQDFLFHGPDLQAIENVDGCSEQGIAATVKAAPKPSSWIKQPLRSSWIADPLVLDSSFQMMILWSFENHGAGSLPTYAGRYEQFRPFPKDKVKVNIQVTGNSGNKALANIEFADQQGTLIARIENYECVIDPSLKKAFANNHIT